MENQIEKFIAETELKIADDAEIERLYNKNIQISLDGEYCLIPFGADEWYTIVDALEHIKENI
ncbi:hypothetical protein GKG47_09055 [Lactonifactor sp. BIOML-A3]|uniref:hypothetical protein n=1 Tax=unclassified Lactonifactor TaxID=2636670 RepID=UPI0012AF0025|nr:MULTISPECIES: hypothetical protein [unclassified Lactonifactor]MSA02186.1 hypothetical protein [Lactonifactor sp. BIOML-A5]MSA07971.1 hypothetical protein [Lactonifactor sp. BIOML-A4]MSA12587.1 hypothetical protein [Lactonifactor sp. BIOML-A3]MSA16712.1 hypothetical protein [Lactonifactor sp. BIOML-A2]MSA37589.1 hypothetical protein [Lactonifactor sp. BIOML-A1]